MSMSSIEQKKKRLAALELQRDILNLEKQIASSKQPRSKGRAVVRNAAEAKSQKKQTRRRASLPVCNVPQQIGIDYYKKELTEVKKELQRYRERCQSEIEQVREQLKQETSNHKNDLKDVYNELLKVRNELKRSQEKAQNDRSKVCKETASEMARLKTEFAGQIAKELQTLQDQVRSDRLLQVRNEALTQITKVKMEIQAQCQAELEERMHREMTSTKTELQHKQQSLSSELEEIIRHESDSTKTEIQQQLQKDSQQLHETLSTELRAQQKVDIEELQDRLADAERLIMSLEKQLLAASVNQRTYGVSLTKQQGTDAVNISNKQKTFVPSSMQSVLSGDERMLNRVSKAAKNDKRGNEEIDSSDEVKLSKDDVLLSRKKNIWNGKEVQKDSVQAPSSRRDTAKTQATGDERHNAFVSMAKANPKAIYSDVQNDERVEAAAQAVSNFFDKDDCVDPSDEEFLEAETASEDSQSNPQKQICKEEEQKVEIHLHDSELSSGESRSTRASESVDDEVESVDPDVGRESAAESPSFCTAERGCDSDNQTESDQEHEEIDDLIPVDPLELDAGDDFALHENELKLLDLEAEEIEVEEEVSASCETEEEWTEEEVEELTEEGLRAFDATDGTLLVEAGPECHPKEPLGKYSFENESSTIVTTNSTSVNGLTTAQSSFHEERSTGHSSNVQKNSDNEVARKNSSGDGSEDNVSDQKDEGSKSLAVPAVALVSSDQISETNEGVQVPKREAHFEKAPCEDSSSEDGSESDEENSASKGDENMQSLAVTIEDVATLKVNATPSEDSSSDESDSDEESSASKDGENTMQPISVSIEDIARLKVDDTPSEDSSSDESDSNKDCSASKGKADKSPIAASANSAAQIKENLREDRNSSDDQSNSDDDESDSESSDDSEASSNETSDESSSTEEKDDVLVPAESLKIDDADELTLRKNALRLLGIGVDEAKEESSSGDSSEEEESDKEDELENRNNTNKKPRGVLRASSFDGDNAKWPPSRRGRRNNSISFSEKVTTKEIPKLDVEDKMNLFFDRDDLKRFKEDHKAHLERKAAKRLFKLGSKTAIDSLPSFWG